MAKINKSEIRSLKGRYANRDVSIGASQVLPGNITLDVVYDSLHEMIFTKDVKGRITSANEAFAKYVGIPKDELIGKTAFEMDGMPREAAEAIARVDEKVISRQQAIIDRAWNKFANGTSAFTETETTPLIEGGEVVGVLVTIRDLTELKMMMDEVEKQNDILETISKVSTLMLEPDINAFKRSIYEAMAIIAKGINAQRIDIWKRRFNDGGERQYTLEYAWSDKSISLEADTRNELVVVEQRAVSFMESIITRGRAINSRTRDLTPGGQDLIRNNGIEEALSTLIMPIILNDEYWGFISAFDLKNERVFTDNEEMLLRSSRQMIASTMTRMEITNDLMHQTDRLKYEIDSKRDFLARMSHEIRTPLNAILGMTELALRERMSNVANEHIMTVKQTGMNLLAIINDILDFSKIESGNMEIINTEYALSSLIYDIISIIRMRLAYTRIRFIVDIDSNLPSGVIGDEGKIRQILINLLSNAVKYTQKGFIKLTIKGEVSDDGILSLVMVVTDSGKGIREEDQKKLFRDYIQVDKEKNIGIEGVGLGLSICHGLVSAMDGYIALKSEYGEGSEFAVTIPQKIVNFEKLAEVTEPGAHTTLIYERRSMYVETLVQAIENLGIVCDVVDNADDVLKKMKSGKYSCLIGSNELLAEIRYKLEEIGGDYQIIGIAEFGDETDSVWRTLSTPVHTISLANVYNGEADRYMYSDDEDASTRFSAPEARILVVDDITTNLKVAAGLLSIFDVDIDVCNSGQEAIELVSENRYDIVFMDHRMPGMDGVETTQYIRSMGEDNGKLKIENGKSGEDNTEFSEEDREYFKNVPIVVLTANVMSNMKEMFLQSGFNDFVAKPIDTVILSNVMRKWIPRSKQRRYYAVDEEKERAALSMDADMLIKIPGVDVEKGFRTSGGRMDIYLEILATFVDEANERLTQLHEFTETGDLRHYTITVHALKGALANIGAGELSTVAAKLEAAGERKDAEFIEKNNERFCSGIGRLLNNINTVLSETAKSAGDGKKVSKKETERFVATLEELKKALEQMDAGTMNKAVETLLGDAITEQSLSTVRLISKHILMAEYDDAEQIIGNLISTIKG